MYSYSPSPLVGGGALGGATARRVTVAVDIDECLNRFSEALRLWHNATHGSALEASDFHSYHFADVWGGSDADTKAKMDAFFASDAFASLAPMAEAAVTLRTLRHSHCRFVVVTSRHHALADATRAWIARHFCGCFDDVLFGNHYGEGPK